MRHFSFLIKPASALCNMRCHYCFYAEVSQLRRVASYGIMQPDITQGLLQNIYAAMAEGDDVSFAFQGGEPTLAGLAYFKQFIALVNAQKKQVTVHYALQTNGLVIDEAWCDFLKEHHFLVGLSLDGDGKMHDENRVDATQKGTFSRIMHTKHLFDAYQIEYNILWVLTNHHARYPAKVWNFLRQENIAYVQFIPCLSELSGTHSAYALTPQRFASFYTELFKFWKKDLRSGYYISVKLFDDLFNLLTKHAVTACGFTGVCQAQFIIEADGSTYPCDFFVTDAWRSGNLAKQPYAEIENSEAMQKFLNRPHEVAALCQNCAYQKMCGGGCPRMRNNMYLNETETFCGYKTFLEDSRTEIDDFLRQY
ncbi:MAG: SPASM domain-containing protein [Ruthenibacterium sp.]